MFCQLFIVIIPKLHISLMDKSLMVVKGGGCDRGVTASCFLCHVLLPPVLLCPFISQFWSFIVFTSVFRLLEKIDLETVKGTNISG